MTGDDSGSRTAPLWVRLIAENRSLLDMLAAYDTCTCGNPIPVPPEHSEHCPFRGWSAS